MGCVSLGCLARRDARAHGAARERKRDPGNDAGPVYGLEHLLPVLKPPVRYTCPRGQPNPRSPHAPTVRHPPTSVDLAGLTHAGPIRGPALIPREVCRPQARAPSLSPISRLRGRPPSVLQPPRSHDQPAGCVGRPRGPSGCGPARVAASNPPRPTVMINPATRSPTVGGPRLCA